MRQVAICETNEKKGAFWAESTAQLTEAEAAMQVVNVYPDVTDQTFRGFGGAFTEAAAHTYAGMSGEKKRELIKAYYGPEGLNYRFGRVTIHSCDFALGNYTYVEEGDRELSTFSIAHDKEEILPLIHDAQDAAGGPVTFLASPWSPPAYMKDNGDMNHGGKLLSEYEAVWAKYFAKFIQAYGAENVKIGYVTVQNEPAAVQTWDSCIFSAKEEGSFVSRHLGPMLEKEGLSDVNIFVWDHNKESAYDRFRDAHVDERAASYIKGCALHWYTGDHFECTELIRRKFPGKEVFFSEGCVEYSRFADSGETEKAEMYAHDILGNLNAGITASIDWNLYLDEKGGPNHVGNFCAAPVMCDPKNDTYEKRLTYYYIGQFSRFLKEGAVRIGTTRYTDKLEVTAFLNPDGERVVVVLNRTGEAVPFILREESDTLETQIDAHTIQTLRYH